MQTWLTTIPKKLESQLHHRHSLQAGYIRLRLTETNRTGDRILATPDTLTAVLR